MLWWRVKGRKTWVVPELENQLNLKKVAKGRTHLYVRKEPVPLSFAAFCTFKEENMNYLEKLKNPRWQKKRLEVLERDEWHCQNCGDGATTLHVHHKYYIKGKKPWEYPLDAFLTLCDSCHEYEHTERDGNEKDLLSMIKIGGFLADDVGEIAAAFHSIYLPYPPQVMAVILHYALSTEKTMNYLSSEYFNSIHRENGG